MDQKENNSDQNGGNYWLKITVPACVVLIVFFLISGAMFTPKKNRRNL